MVIDCSKYAGKCACGRVHTMETRAAVIEPGCLFEFEKYMAQFGVTGKRCALYGENSYAATADRHPRAEQQIVLDPTGLHANEISTAEVLAKLEGDVEVIVAVGSGTIHDIARFCAHERGIRFVSCPTGASVDGFCSTVAAMTWYGFKKTLPAVAPEIVLADTEIIKNAPMELVRSGVGDIMAKYTALADWKMAHVLTNELLCEKIYSIMQDAADTVMQSVPGIARGEESAYANVTYALIMSGIAMQMMGNSRPASGAEHHMSHFWETIIEQRGERPAMHGEQVAVGTVLVLRLIEELLAADVDFDAARRAAREYDKAAWESEIRAVYGAAAQAVIDMEAAAGKNDTKARLRRIDSMEKNWDAVCAQLRTLPPAQEIYALLHEVGCPCTPREIGVDKALLKQTFMYCKEIRARYTVFQTVYDLGLLDELSDRVIAKTETL